MQAARRGPWISTVPGFAALALLFLALMCAGLSIYYRSDHVTAIRPMSGVALALCMIYGRPVLWRIIVASFIAGAAARLLFGETIPLSLIASGMISGLIWGAYLLVRRIIGPNIDFWDWKQQILFMAVVTGASAASGLVYSAILLVFFAMPFEAALRSWLVPSIVSFVINTPLVMVAAQTDMRALWRRRYRLAGCVVLVLASLVENFVPGDISLKYFTPLALIVVAQVAEVEGTVLCLLVIEIFITAAAIKGVSLPSFRQLPIPLQLNFSQVMVAALTIVMLPVAAAIAQGRKLSVTLGNALLREEQIADELRKSEGMYRQLAEHASDIIVQTDLDSLIVYVSPAIKSVLGYEAHEVLGKDCLSYVPEQDRRLIQDIKDRLLQAGTDGTSLPVQYRVRHKNGSIVWLENRQSLISDAAGQPLGYVSVLRDITEKRERDAQLATLNAELAHVARISAIGQMSAAIAHELNQPLLAISNYANAAKRYLEKNVQAGDLIDHARQAVDKAAGQAIRAGGIIRGLRDFLEKRPAQMKPDDLNAILKEAISLTFLGGIGGDVDVRLQLSAEPLPVLVDRVQIEQVMHNLMRNGIEAMQGAPLRRMVIATGRDGEDFAYFEIWDYGPGIPEDELAALFQPFHTTKEDGMGMGLSISKTIIGSHNGTILVTNRSPGGACFRVRLPLDTASVRLAG